MTRDVFTFFLFVFVLSFAGRRPRIGATAKGQLKVSAGKKDCKSLRKLATNGVNELAIVETITQRTRNLRKKIHKIQRQFDNQAITKFFQRTLKAHSYPRFGGDDENACDAFTADQLTNLNDGSDDGGDGGGGGSSGSNNDLTKSDNDAKEFSALNGDANDGNNGDMKNDEALNLCINDGDRTDENSNGHGNITSISIQPTNIFLQKPVLHLDIDKSQIQASSIIINKHLDACPNFATAFSAFNSSVLNTANNKIQSKSSEDESSAEQNDMHAPNETNANDQKTKCEKPRLRKRRPRKCATRWAIDANGLKDAINDSDSNSCDSGVVSDRSFELSSTDGNKPTTPHRIVCPSTSTPTHEDSPKILPQSNAARVNAIKRPTVKRARGKIAPKR